MIKLNNTAEQIAVLWSGGLDSTYLVYSALRAGSTVTPIYVQINNNCEKPAYEEIARKKIRESFCRMALPGILCEDLKLNIGVENLSDSRLLFMQMPIWIIATLYVNPSIQKILIGYCMNDDAVSYLAEIKKIYHSYKHLMSDKKMPKLGFPLSKIKKREMFIAMPEEISQLTVFCENPTGKIDCGRCDSCERYKHEDLFYRYTRNQLQKEESLSIEPLKTPDLIGEKHLSVDDHIVHEVNHEVPTYPGFS
jgi:7-cyano-7-deazaguanine synthase in queuosine biosynthesis